jgi:hypothetical protein
MRNLFPAAFVSILIGMLWYSGHTAFSLGIFAFLVVWCLFDLVEKE